MRLKGQIGNVPYEAGFKTHTAWDIGVRDSTSIIFFQTIGTVVHIIDYYENSKVGLEHYIKVLEQKPYVYGKHIGPHDIKVKEWGSGMTRIEKAKQLGISFTVAPDLSIEDGIESVRSAFSKIWIDDKSCGPLLKALENYRQEYDVKRNVYKANPLHDFSSHACFSADTLVLTRSGIRQIINIQDNDEVITANGWEKCIGARKTQKNVKLIQVKFVDGVKVRCTPDHLFLTENGWISAENLRTGSMILLSRAINLNRTMVKYIGCGDKDTFNTAMGPDYISKFGEMLMGVFQKIAIFITKIVTNKIIPYLTWFVCLLPNTGRYRSQMLKDSVKKRELLQMNGMQVKLDANGIANMQTESKVGIGKLESKGCVCSAEKKRYCSKEKTIPKSSATQTAKHLMVEDIEKVEGLHDVWCINVPKSGHFALANGAIVSNSDAMRYLCISLPKTRDGLSAEDLDKRYREAMYGDNEGMPQGFFRDESKRMY